MHALVSQPISGAGILFVPAGATTVYMTQSIMPHHANTLGITFGGQVRAQNSNSIGQYMLCLLGTAVSAVRQVNPALQQSPPYQSTKNITCLVSMVTVLIKQSGIPASSSAVCWHTGQRSKAQPVMTLFMLQVLSWMEQCAYISASRLRGAHHLTASMDGVSFAASTKVGDILYIISEVGWVEPHLRRCMHWCVR